MEIKRFFANPGDISGDVITISGDEFYHAVKVLRHKVGYKIIVCTGEQTDTYATITEIGKDFFVASIEKTEPNNTETKKRITLYQCVTKEIDFIVQKAVELGVKRFVPVISRYVNAQANTERLRKIVLESSKQCGRASLMKILEPLTFQQMAEKALQDEDLVLLPYEHASIGNIRTTVGNEEKIGIVIGSEGGFSDEEVSLITQKGAKIVTLGKRILRAETATVAALTLTLDAAGELN